MDTLNKIADLQGEVMALSRLMGNEPNSKLRQPLYAAYVEKKTELEQLLAEERERAYKADLENRAISVGELIELLSQWPAKAKVWGEWEGIIVPLEASRIRHEGDKVILDVDQ